MAGCSSFDFTTKKGSEMKVLERWKHFIDDEDYRRALRGRHDVLALSNEIFGEIPGTAELI